MAKRTAKRLEDMTLGTYLRWLASTMPTESDTVAHLLMRARQADAMTGVCRSLAKIDRGPMGHGLSHVSPWVDRVLSLAYDAQAAIEVEPLTPTTRSPR